MITALALSLMPGIGATPALAATQTTVSPLNLNGWAFDGDGTTGGAGSFVVGPATAPLGSGSGRMVLDNTTTSRHRIMTLAYAGTRLADITKLEYSTYRSSTDAGNNLAIALQLDTDFDLSDTNVAWQGRLVYEPYLTPGVGGTVVEDTWQTWNPLAGEWWASRAPFDALCSQSNPCNWAEVRANWPNAGLRVDIGLLQFKAGGPAAGFDGNIDAFTITANGVETTFDFEPEPQCSTACYVNGATGNDSYGGTADRPKQTIQAAVSQVSVDGTVHVAAGTYVEQVDIGKSLTLAGADAASTVIQAPAALVSKFLTSGSTTNRPIVYAHDASNVVIQNLTVDGNGAGNANYRFIGVAFRNAGGEISGTTVTRIRATPLSGTQHGIGIYGLNTDSVARSLTISNNTITDYQKNGMTLDGAGLTVTITGNTVTGAGPMGLGLPAQNGIQVSRGAVAPMISGNTISGNFYTGGADAATGMLIYAPGSDTLVIENNTLTGNKVGLYVLDTTSVEITGNEITGAIVSGMESDGIYIYDMSGLNTAGSVTGNTIRTHNYGLVLYDGATGGAPSVTAAFNRIVGNTDAGMYANVPLAAENNWWGCNAGPGQPGCDGLEQGVADAIDANPWLVLGLKAAPTTVAPGGASTLTASLTTNSDGQDTSAAGSVPDITPASFAATMGAIAPASATTTGGAAAATFTAGAITGSAIVTATVDNQAVDATVTIAHPTAELAVSSTSLSFSAHEGGANPAPATLTVSNAATGGPLDWSAGAPTYGAGATGWLSCTPASGLALAPGTSTTVTCSAATAGLAAGTYTASFDVTSETPGVTGSPQTVSVTLVVGGPASVTVAATNGLSTSEGGASASYSLVLTSQPSANVVITIAAGNQLAVAPATLTFTPANWNVPQTVTVTAVDDTAVEGAHTGTISHTSASADADYNGITIAQVSVAIADDDAAATQFMLYLPLARR